MAGRFSTFGTGFFYEQRKEKEWKMNELLNVEVYENGTVAALPGLCPIPR
jgi:hypothetical protein